MIFKYISCVLLFTFSTRSVHTLAKDIRIATGSRNSIEPGLKQKLVEYYHQLDHYFVSEKMRFTREVTQTETVKGKKVTKKHTENFDQDTVHCKDVSSLIDAVLEARQINGERAILRIGLDGGGGFLKICLSAFDLAESDRGTDGAKFGKKFKNSGVKKVLILAIVPDIPENYWNLKKLWIESGIHRIERRFVIATDLKLCNILLGLMSHSSLHPCCWCDADKYHLKECGEKRYIHIMVIAFLLIQMI